MSQEKFRLMRAESLSEWEGGDKYIFHWGKRNTKGSEFRVLLGRANYNELDDTLNYTPMSYSEGEWDVG